MALYNISEFMTMIKEDIGIKNIPLPVDDNELLQRFGNSALKEFSVRCPRIEHVIIDDSDLISPAEYDRACRVTYRINTAKFGNSPIIGIYKFDVARPLGYSDYYVPQGMWASPDSVLTGIADIKIAASVASAMGKAPTFEFRNPDILIVYNGWSGGVYQLDIGLMHDISLSTITPTSFTNLRQLAVVDIEEYLYNKLKRMDNLDVGIGNIQLKLDDWQDAASRKREMLDTWDREGANLDLDQITYF